MKDNKDIEYIKDLDKIVDPNETAQIEKNKKFTTSIKIGMSITHIIFAFSMIII